MARLIGEWTIDWVGFAARRWPETLDKLVTSRVPDVLGGGTVDDFSATVDENRCACEPYLKVVPFGSNSTAVNGMIQDGDILFFVYPLGDSCSNPRHVGRILDATMTATMLKCLRQARDITCECIGEIRRLDPLGQTCRVRRCAHRDTDCLRHKGKASGLS